MHEKAFEAANGAILDGEMFGYTPEKTLRNAFAAFLRAVEPSEGMRQVFDEVEHSVHGGHPDFILRAMASKLADELEGK